MVQLSDLASTVMERTDSQEDCRYSVSGEGTRRIIDNQERVLYDGYWIKTYPVPADSLEAKKR
jgi:hypothetical protein